MRKDILNSIIQIKEVKNLINKSEIARRFNCSINTVNKYLNVQTDKKYTRKYSSKLDNFKGIIIEKTDDFYANGRAIFNFIKDKGFTGSYGTVSKFIKEHKQEEQHKATMRFETTPGFQAQVDWKENFKLNVNNSDINDNNVVNSEENIEWDEITEKGVNEKLLLQNVNTKDLEKISTLLQSLSAEIAQKEKEDINFYLSAGWYKYTLDSQQFNEVINMGKDAIKPLYLIIYKSPNQGSYEYICAMALSKLVNFNDVIDSWSTSKEFLEMFNQKVISDREK